MQILYQTYLLCRYCGVDGARAPAQTLATGLPLVDGLKGLKAYAPYSRVNAYMTGRAVISGDKNRHLPSPAAPSFFALNLTLLGHKIFPSSPLVRS